MASEYQIHQPNVLTTLPKPLDHTDGRINARVVYGSRDGQPTRKRSELIVAVDGEAASLYDVPAHRLITSYPIPPQESFTCPPYSLRVRPSSGHGPVLRYTYVATRDAVTQKLSLFKDTVHADGKTTSTSTSQPLPDSPVKHITTFPATESSSVGDVLVICLDGQVICLSAETLSPRWTASTRSAVEDVVGDTSQFEIQYVSSDIPVAFGQGIFKLRPELLTALPKAHVTTSCLLASVCRCLVHGKASRYLVISAAIPDSLSTANLQKLNPLDVAPLGHLPDGSDGAHAHQIDLQSGLLLELSGDSLDIYDLSDTLPKKKSTAHVPGASSILCLAKPFVLTSSPNELGLYNHRYRSLHATATLDVLAELPAEGRKARCCQLITYLPSQDLVVALMDNVLGTVHVEPPRVHGKRRRGGLLIDSIGRGASAAVVANGPKSDASLAKQFAQLVPGTATEEYLATFQEDVQAADKLLAESQLASWEDLIRKRFGLLLDDNVDMSNGDAMDNGTLSAWHQLPEWKWQAERSQYPPVDRRWLMYAISRSFSVEKTSLHGRPELRLILPDSNVTTYLVIAGCLTLANLRSALRVDLSTLAMSSSELAGDLMHCLTGADPSMTLLLSYLQATKLGEMELLLAIRTLMQSMDLIPDVQQAKEAGRLTDKAADEAEGSDMELDELEREIVATEHYLGDESSTRSRGLTTALTKLWRLPAASTVKALRAVLRPEDMLAMIYLLRVELVRGAWTSLYVDPTSFESEGNEPPPDGVIALIADLLGRCLDAIGAGGWLCNDAVSWADKTEAGDFLTALRLEVAAALEGVEGAVYLNGILTEAVRFGLAAGRKAGKSGDKSTMVTLAAEGRDVRWLPLGLKSKQPPSREKVVSGGEVVRRSGRETGHLISQKVEPYSVERIVV